MTLGGFLDAAYALLVEEYRRLGTDLQTALKELEPYRAGGPAEEIQPGEEQPRPSRSKEAQVAAENQRSLAQLQQLMAGASFGG